MTLYRPQLILESSESHPAEPSCRKDELTHVSEIFAQSGLPVADSLKERMLEELAALIEDEDGSEYEREPLRSA